MSKKSYGSGVATGVIATLGAIVAGVFAAKKTVIDPIDEKENKIAENRKKAARKRTAR
jgi:hypothetical protein